MKVKVKFIIKLLILILMFVWICILVMDYFNAKNNSDMKFCLSESVYIYSEGEKKEIYDGKGFKESNYEGLSYTYECKGLGYKFYRYNRTDTNPPFTAVEFGPFFIKEKQSIKNN